MLTKLQFQTLFGFKPKRRPGSKAGKKVAKKSASKAGKKVVKKSNKVGTRMVKGVKRTVYKGKNGGKFYKKSNGRKVYFGPAVALAKTIGVMGPSKIMYAKAIEGAGYTLGYKVANAGVSMLKKSLKKKKKSVAMGRKKIVAGKKRTVYKAASGAKYYKSAKGNKVYFGRRGGPPKIPKAPKVDSSKYARADHRHNDLVNAMNMSNNKIDQMMRKDMRFGKKRKTSRRNTRFGNHGNATLSRSMGPAPIMFGSHIPSF